MKTPCKPVVKLETDGIEMWCETCKRLLAVRESRLNLEPDLEHVAIWEAFKDKSWRDHLNTVLLAEKSLKSNVGAIKPGSDVTVECSVMFQSPQGRKLLGYPPSK